MILALADFFDVSLDYLVGRTDDPEFPHREKTTSDREKFFDEFNGLRKENLDKAISYVALLREIQRREEEVSPLS